VASATSAAVEPPWSAEASVPRHELMAWYRAHGRHDLDWRRTRDPYAVLVSEVMLQQTQVQRMLPYYRDWLARWPDPQSLAAVPLADAIRAWAGLGYNRRAIHLHRAATVVIERHGGVVPASPSALRALPGVGWYTAAAVGSFAFGQRVAVVDTNVARVLARAAGGRADAHALLPRRIEEEAASLLPAQNARDHNLALMDLGALVCRARSPACASCPLQAGCAWLAAGCPPAPPALRATEPFEATRRYGRGRVLSVLRAATAPMAEAEVGAALPAPHQERLESYLRALEREGLVEHGAGGWRLPGGAQGSSSMASPKL
jgi:A/G-specific adenine glycosylase